MGWGDLPPKYFLFWCTPVGFKGSFWVWAQPMRGSITMSSRLSWAHIQNGPWFPNRLVNICLFLVCRDWLLSCWIFWGSINPLCAKFFRGNKSIYLHFVSFLLIDMTQGSWNPVSSKRSTYLFYKVNIMSVDVLATQGPRASATMIFTVSNQINLFAFSIISQHWEGAFFLNPSLWKTWTIYPAYSKPCGPIA